MRDKDNPIIKVKLDSGKVVEMYLHEAIAAGLVDEDEREWIRDKERKPSRTKQRKK